MTDRFMARAILKTEGSMLSFDSVDHALKYLKEDIQEYPRMSAKMKRRIIETISLAEQEISRLSGGWDAALYASDDR